MATENRLPLISSQFIVPLFQSTIPVHLFQSSDCRLPITHTKYLMN